jgi:monoamine oxidase
MDADVLILGAGFTGVAAARDLRDAGRSAIVLEARDRIGGRTWYREIPDTGVWAEYGGMFISRSTQPFLADEIQRYGIAVTEPTDPDVLAWIRGRERKIGTGAIDGIRAKLRESRLTDSLEETAKAFAGEGRETLARFDVPVSGWVDELGADPEAADYLRSFMAAMGGSSIDRMSVLPLLWDMVELDSTPVDAYVDMGEIFTDGTKSLIDAMADGLDVRFGAVVRRVDHNADGVTVMLDDGSTLTAATAIVALPLNVWADIEFEPALAPPKQRAAAQRHVGEVSKVIAIVRDAPSSYLGSGWDTPVSAGFISKPAADGQLFMGFSSQQRVDLADAAAASDAVRAHIPDAEVVWTGGHDWVTDPYAKGTWLSVPPTWFSDGTFDALREPEGRLLFAGSDIAAEGAGWIEGAVGSGREAAADAQHLLA